PDGMRVAGVVENSMAMRAGLLPGDIVTSIAKQPTRNLCELSHALRVAGRAPTTQLIFVRGADLYVREVEAIELARDPNVTYGEHRGLRTLATQPPNARALIVFLQGIACESVDAPLADTPLEALIQSWTAAGYATLRFDKRGIGDSDGGPCREIDFATELADARAIVEHAASRGLPLIIFGHSVGGIMAPLLAKHASALIVYGTPVMPWLECLQDSVRRQLELRHVGEHTIVEQVAQLARLADDGELNGRSAAYHRQLAELDIAAAWRTVDAPVLVVRGEHDWVVRPDDQARIAELARGAVTIVDVPALDHLFGAHADRDASLRDYGIGAARGGDSLARVTLDWLARGVA
ncbi:MAG TPA: alpha/beta fold hydrolase, partial [Kofleriaceae bacterium]|nr:alpha/beta fold hydrolase [Kofleriaceae bacterium]